MDDLYYILPEIVLVVTAVGILAADFVLPEDSKPNLAWPAALGTVVALGLVISFWGTERSLYNGTLRIDDYAVFFKVMFLVVGFFVLIGSPAFARRNLRHTAEFYGLILFAVVGAMAVSSARELLTAYISLELVSFGFYALSAHAKDERRSNEAGAKYIILGAFSSALLLYGISLVFGAAGTTFYVDISAQAETAAGLGPGLLMGIALLVAGLGFKVAAVPFHMWTPDVYEGAPLPVTAFLSVGSKAAGFAFLIRLFVEGLQPVMADWRDALGILAILTMTLGNLVAMQQRNIKRLLAYSSIAQAGYVLVGVPVLTMGTAAGMMLHLAGYAVTNLGAFLVVIFYNNATGREKISEFRGMSRRSLPLALMLAICLFSLAGMPLFAGFVTKFYLFSAVAAHGLWWLVAFAIGNSIVSVYYYLVVVREMFVTPSDDDEEDRKPLRIPVHSAAALTALAGLVLWIGLYPDAIVRAAENGSRAIFGG